tara:strand:- start:1675 stop:2238 length:564 start_codon:yes stop_codon:yes gene_type:complete
MKIWEYKNYEDYVENQSKANERKSHWTYVMKETMHIIVKDRPFASTVLCHGTRNGAEQKFFKNLLPNAEIIGTEIGPTAHKFPMTIKHDFQFPLENFVNYFDIVYSNSFDHSIYPDKCLQTWRDQLNDSGRLYLEYSEEQSGSTNIDPLEATLSEVEKMIEKNGLYIRNRFKWGRHNGNMIIAGKCK